VISAVGLVVLLLGVWPNHWFEGTPDLDRDESSSSSSSSYDYGDSDDALGKVSFDFGLREISSCAMGACPTTDYESLSTQLGMLDDDDDDGGRGDGGRSQLERYVWSGRVTFYSGMIGGLALLGSILLWAMRQRLPFSLSAVGGALAVVTAIAGTIAFTTEPVVPGLGRLMQLDIEMGLGFPVTLVGVAISVVGAFQLHKEERGFAPFGSGGHAYPQPYYGQPPYQAGPSPYQAGPSPYQAGPSPYLPQPMAGPASQISPACPRCTAPTIFVVEHQRYFCSSCRAYL